MADVTVVVLATLDTKDEEARFVSAQLAAAGVAPLLIDLSLRPHGHGTADITGAESAAAAGASWDELAELDRAGATETMVRGATAMLTEVCAARTVAGAIGLGGANGTAMACALMRTLAPLVPKVMVSAVAATAAVQWYVAESDIAMFASIGDLAMNRITRAVLENASTAIAAMAHGHASRAAAADDDAPPLVGVSTFGTTQACVDRVTERLVAAGLEVIHFHASGPGGKALEALAGQGQLAGVVDITTHELTDLVVDGVYSAGDGRLRAAGAVGVPQLIVPGAIDFANFWVGQVPAKFVDREFFQYNAQNILMRTGAKEFRTLGRLFAERLDAATGPVAVLIPTGGFSENTTRMTHDLAGREIGPWQRPAVDAVFTDTLRANLKKARMVELDTHINDPEFADACVDTFLELMHKHADPGLAESTHNGN